jgi:starch phosphorylase
LADWKHVIRKAWPKVAVRSVICDHPHPFGILVGQKITIRARVFLGTISPDHVIVEVYYGETDDGELQNPATNYLEKQSQEEDGSYWYSGQIEASESGVYGFNVRVLPTHPNLTQKHELRLFAWGQV